MKKVVILIPAYEPTIAFIDLLKSLSQYKYNIIVVNDGSNKEFDYIFKQAKEYATVIEHSENKGKGVALKTGLTYINKNFSKHYSIVTMDCDGQHSIKDAIKLCDYVIKHPDELVLGKRIRSKKTPLRSRLGNAITRFSYRITTGLDIYDTQTGLRAFSNELVPFMLSIEGERFEYEMNVLLNCPINKIKIKEIEIETIYIDNNSHSHFNSITDSALVYKKILKFLMSSLVCFVIDYILFILIITISNKLVLSNIAARLISATVNFNINKKIVFKNKEKKYLKQLLKYAILAAGLLIINTIVLTTIVDYIHINEYVAKIITEIILFFISWTVQRKIIFNPNK